MDGCSVGVGSAANKALRPSAIGAAGSLRSGDLDPALVSLNRSAKNENFRNNLPIEFGPLDQRIFCHPSSSKAG